MTITRVSHFNMELCTSPSSSTLPNIRVPRKYIPWTKSPLHPNARKVPNDTSKRTELHVHNSVIDLDEQHLRGGDSEIPVFRKHREASSLELYYDLYFVANLTTFTAYHDIENLESGFQASLVC